MDVFQSIVEILANLIAIFTFPVFCLAFFRQSATQELQLIDGYRSRLAYVQREYRSIARLDNTVLYDDATIDLISVFEDLAFAINSKLHSRRARRYLEGELWGDLKYLLNDDRFKGVFVRNLQYNGSLVELERLARRLIAAAPDDAILSIFDRTTLPYT